MKTGPAIVAVASAGLVLCGCAGNPSTRSASITTPHPIGWAARTCASALTSVRTTNVLVEAYPTSVAVYLLQYRTEENRYHPAQPTTSVFRTLSSKRRLAFCVTMAPSVEWLAHGAAHQDCPFGFFPSNGPSSSTFDGSGEQFYAADSAGVIERVHFAAAPMGDPPGCFGGAL